MPVHARTSPTLLWIGFALIVGFSAGSVFERRGWTPRFYDLDAIQAKNAVARSIELTGDTLRAAVARQDLIIGSAGPLVTVYTNFECPYCARFDSTIRTLALQGRYRFNYRHLVYAFQRSAYRKHRLVACSRVAGLPVNELVRKAFTLPKTVDWRLSVVLDSFDARSIERVEACVAGEGEMAERVDEVLRADSVAARRAGIAGTPSWIIGGHMGVGALSERAFDVVYAALASPERERRASS